LSLENKWLNGNLRVVASIYFAEAGLFGNLIESMRHKMPLVSISIARMKVWGFVIERSFISVVDLESCKTAL